MKKILFAVLITSIYAKAQSGKPLCYFSGSGNAWQGSLALNDSTSLNFYFKLNLFANPEIIIYNAEEAIIITEIKQSADSLFFKMPVFDSEFRCKWQTRYEKSDSLSGVWINHARKNKNTIPFSANKIAYKTVAPCGACNYFAGKWETTFSPNDNTNQYKAVGIFSNPHCWDFIYGTFLTETGDYRYLCGNTELKYKNRMERQLADTIIKLQCFDGSHAFVFTGKKLNDGTIAGDFYSGSHWHEKWVAKRNDTFELQNPDSLTFLKKGFDKINFLFKNIEGKTIALTDEKFKDKVVIVQLMGSWCPNCMDETKYLTTLYNKYKNKGLEIIALAFEKTNDYEKAKQTVIRLQKKYNVQYEILITEKVGKGEASDALPMLNTVLAFPTTIYIDKKGNVRKIYTGFTGPGTGTYYEKWVEQNEMFIDMLLKE